MPVLRKPSVGDCITRLSDGACYTAEDLAESFSVSRSIILRFMADLRAAGAPIVSRRGCGYMLIEKINILDGEEIFSFLSPLAQARLGQPAVLLSVNSTNSYLLDRSRKKPAPDAMLCLAEHQTQGRGRRERTWLSPYGSGLYMSVLWRYPEMPANLSALSPSLALACVKVLHALGVQDLAVKWPNDILWRNWKLAGILIESRSGVNQSTHLVFGLGVNVAMPKAVGQCIDQAWADLAQALGARCPSRNLLAALMANAAVTVLSAFEHDEPPDIVDEWQRWDAMFRREVEIERAGERFVGQSLGINAQGCLLLRTKQGIEVFTDGEASLRALK